MGCGYELAWVSWNSGRSMRVSDSIPVLNQVRICGCLDCCVAITAGCVWGDMTEFRLQCSSLHSVQPRHGFLEPLHLELTRHWSCQYRLSIHALLVTSQRGIGALSIHGFSLLSSSETPAPPTTMLTYHHHHHTLCRHLPSSGVWEGSPMSAGWHCGV